MAIVKCMNPKCDYFERAVPEGDCCPYCGEPLNSESTSANYQEPYIPPQPEPVPFVPPAPPEPTPYVPPPVIEREKPLIRTVIEPKNISLQLVHTNSGQCFTIDRYSAINKIYLGRQEGIPRDVPVKDLSELPFAERISHLHAYVTWDNNRNSFTITDNESTNGTILNGQSLTPRQPYPLNPGDRLEFGREQKIIFQVEII